jgi:hypothetical protein
MIIATGSKVWEALGYCSKIYSFLVVVHDTPYIKLRI